MSSQLSSILFFIALSAGLIGVGALIGPGWAIGAAVLALLLNTGASFFRERLRGVGERKGGVSDPSPAARPAALPPRRWEQWLTGRYRRPPTRLLQLRKRIYG